MKRVILTSIIALMASTAAFAQDAEVTSMDRR